MGKKKKSSEFHQPFHSVRHREARLGHNLPRLLRHLRHSLNLAQLVRMLAELPQNLIALLCRSGGKIVIADGDDAGYDSNDLCEVFVERWRRCGGANAG